MKEYVPIESLWLGYNKLKVMEEAKSNSLTYCVLLCEAYNKPYKPGTSNIEYILIREDGADMEVVTLKAANRMMKLEQL